MLYVFQAVSPPIIRSSKLYTQLTVAASKLMGRETARNMYSIDSNKEYCITLHLVGYT
jgi:hypothetical protein